MISLKLARKRKGLSQQKLSLMTGIHQSMISSIERGVYSPSDTHRLLIEKVVGKVDLPMDTELSYTDKRELMKAFHACIEQYGVRKALNMFSSTRSNYELKKVIDLFRPRRHEYQL